MVKAAPYIFNPTFGTSVLHFFWGNNCPPPSFSQKHFPKKKKTIKTPPPSLPASSAAFTVFFPRLTSANAITTTTFPTISSETLPLPRSSQFQQIDAKSSFSLIVIKSVPLMIRILR
ncbi:hypothetical protein RND81_13G069300 [Saponaria officinalis]|uniref:Uncharacterized protein n=1 Tax=Saponaria officinalis TaxID=3572 RepID=A0AAW1GZI1_SAPOF